MESTWTTPEAVTGPLALKVLAYSETIERIVVSAKDPGFDAEAGWASLEAMLDVERFERVGNDKARMGWAVYRDLLNQWAGTTAFWNGNLRVMTVPDADHFTCTVTDTGPTAGTVRLVAAKVFRLHDVRLNEHRFQMPRVTGYSYSSGSAFGWFDKQMRRLMALLVPSENTGTLWVKSGIAIGGTVSDVTTASPDVTITGGVAAPSATAPDGSIYLRTNGTLWQRRAGAWVQLAA